jgi:PPM family protein phosphatase
MVTGVKRTAQRAKKIEKTATLNQSALVAHTSSSKLGVCENVRLPFTFARHSVPHEWHPDRNDDMLLVDAARGLAAVFDGVGHGPGYVASNMATQIVRQRWRLAHSQPSLLKIDTVMDQEALDAEIRTLLFETNHAIYLEGEQRTRHLSDPNEKDRNFPATTVALVVLSRKANERRYVLTCAHVGDSRVYLLPQDGELQRLTDDDGFLSLRLKDGSINNDDALRIDQATALEQLNAVELGYFSWRNGITQSLGEPEIDVHIGHAEVATGDRILLCSDGIHDNLTDRELATFLHKGKRTTAARLLVRHAIARSHEDEQVVIRAKRDDMSAIVITCCETEEHS